MFFRTMLKINRCLLPNKNSLFQYGWLYKTYRNNVSKSTSAIPWANKQVNYSSTYTRNLEQRKTDSAPKMESPAMAPRTTKDENIDNAQEDSILKPKNMPLSIEEQKVQGLQPSSMPNYYTSNMSKLSCFPEEVSSPIRRKFEKSSTQIAMTMPFKLARLANPFPDPVKIQSSNTISDEEKSMQMQEEAKMEARYRLQQQQEVIMRQQMKEANYRKQPDEIQIAADDAALDELMEPMQMKEQRSTAPQAKGEKKSRTRAARYLKGSRNAQRTKIQDRKYSSDAKVVHPEMLSDMEQCDLILQRLKSLHPEYKLLKRPVCIPGSQEEKEFVKTTLKYIAKHKNELNRRTAPFPSYSEVKTFVREPRTQDVKFVVKANTDEIGNTKELLAVESNMMQTRKFSSKIDEDKCHLSGKKPRACPKFKVTPCADERPTACKHLFADDKCKKTEAPYPSYSECCDDGYENLPDECEICPYKQDIGEAYKGYKRPDEPKRHSYSTCASQFIADDMELCKAKKAPCKSPCKPPECDYAETAKRNRARKGRGSKGPIKKKPKNNLAAVSPTLITNDSLVETPDETSDIHLIRLSDNEFISVENIPGYMCGGGGTCDTTNKGCPKQKRKDSASDKKKCRQKKKRPVPNCHEIVNKKKKKAMQLPVENIEDKPYYGETVPTPSSPSVVTNLYNQVNDQISMVDPIEKPSNEDTATHVLLKDNCTIGNDFLPFKLKQQFWKCTS